MAERLCKHGPCGCGPAPEQPYCAASCQRADREGAPGDPVTRRKAACRCGHPECNPDNAARFASEEAPVP